MTNLSYLGQDSKTIPGYFPRVFAPFPAPATRFNLQLTRMVTTPTVLSFEHELFLAGLRGQIADSSLLPQAYAQYRPLLAEGMDFFLRHLTAGRLNHILSEQMQLPASVALEQRVELLLRQAPALHKLGQVVARDRRLTPGLRRRLQRLESMPSRLPNITAVRALDAECPGWRRAGIHLAPRPLAEGSVAVLLAFTWKPHGSSARQGVFKFLKPGVQDRLAEDLQILPLLGTFLEEKCDELTLPVLDYRDTFETIQELLLHEVELDQEQQHLAEAAEFYAHCGSVQIPELLPFCTPRLTAMSRLRGKTMSEASFWRSLRAEQSAKAAHKQAQSIARALVAEPFFSPHPAALFHADPHAGNLLWTQQGRLGIVDWSLTGRLSRPERAAIAQLLLAAMALDKGAVARAVSHLARGPLAEPALDDVLEERVNQLFQGTLPGVVWLTGLFDQLGLRAKARFSPDLLLFRKVLLTLDGLLADLVQAQQPTGAEVLDAALGIKLLERWLDEWPERLLASPEATSPALHISNSDLLWLCLAGPATWMRWWQHTAFRPMEPAANLDKVMPRTGAARPPMQSVSNTTNESS